MPNPSEPFLPFDQERLELIRELRPRVVSFHFGLPSSNATQEVKASGCVVLSSATTVAEAQQLEAGGADAIIAQGIEAGGHRGTFTKSPGAGTIGTLALVPQIVDAVRVPVIAAGGISDGRGIAAAFALGASGVQMGTAFLGCPEAKVLPVYREALRAATEEETVITRAFTGRPARALRCRLVGTTSRTWMHSISRCRQAFGTLWRIQTTTRAALSCRCGRVYPCVFCERSRLVRYRKDRR